MENAISDLEDLTKEEFARHKTQKEGEEKQADQDDELTDRANDLLR